MRTTIDKAGRLVIPRALRNRIGLPAGGEVEVEIDGAGIRVEPVITGNLREQDGLLLIPATGTTLDDDAVRALIDDDRNSR
jgi:AbrB family looped-hinge helix DNA binding protein